MHARGVPSPTNGTRSLSEVRGRSVQAGGLRKKKGNTDVQVSPFVPDRLGRPLPSPGVEDAVARADLQDQPLARSEGSDR